jgi:hypothetical protein
MINQKLIDDILHTKCNICESFIDEPKNIQFYYKNMQFLNGYSCNCVRSVFGICNDNKIFHLRLYQRFCVSVRFNYFDFKIYKVDNIKLIDGELDLTQFNTVFELQNYLNKYYELELFE